MQFYSEYWTIITEILISLIIQLYVSLSKLYKVISSKNIISSENQLSLTTEYGVPVPNTVLISFYLCPT